MNQNWGPDEQAKNHDQELKNLFQHTADGVTIDYYNKCSDFLASIALHSELDDKDSIPLEIWVGIAQALADASGYRVNLQAQVIEPDKDAPKRSKLAGLREVVVALPTRFVKAIESSAVSELKSTRFIKIFV